jgi:hypothetical protein
MAKVNQEFVSAPAGRRVIWQMLFALLGALAGITGALVATFNDMGRHTSSTTWIAAAIAPAAALLVGVPSYLAERARVSKFRIEENSLVLGKERLPLEGMVSAERDPEVLRKARRICGNALQPPSGFTWFSSRSRAKLCAITGSFRSERLGRFYAFLTDTEHAVVLRWPDKVVAVSPSDPEFFILMVRSGAGLR